MECGHKATDTGTTYACETINDRQKCCVHYKLLEFVCRRAGGQRTHRTSARSTVSRSHWVSTTYILYYIYYSTIYCTEYVQYIYVVPKCANTTTRIQRQRQRAKTDEAANGDIESERTMGKQLSDGSKPNGQMLCVTAEGSSIGNATTTTTTVTVAYNVMSVHIRQVAVSFCVCVCETEFECGDVCAQCGAAWLRVVWTRDTPAPLPMLQ